MTEMPSSWYQFPIFNLYVKPTYSVLLPQRGKREQTRSQLQLKTEENLKDNRVKGELSKTSSTKLKNAINWLTAAAPTKRVYHKQSKSYYKFKLNFITLTLPTTDHNITDEYFKKKMLHNFLNTARYKFKLNNYIWKVETQKNGNIHAHITSDTFIHYEDLRKCWNKILIKHNVMQPYTEKHSKLTFEDYNNLYNPDNKHDILKIQKAFSDGCNSDWKNPNSTDVKAVHKIQDIASYLAKYLSKSDDERRQIKGRLWGCSYALSQANNLTIEVNPDNEKEILKCLMKKEIQFKELTIEDKLTSQPRKIGELFMHALKDWGTTITGELLDIYNEHLFFIRNNINTLALKSFDYTVVPEIQTIEIVDKDDYFTPIEFCPF